MPRRIKSEPDVVHTTEATPRTTEAGSSIPDRVSSIQDRVIEVRTMDPRTLEANPMNWRRHPEGQVTVLDRVLHEVGSVTQVIWNKRSNRLIDGHLRVERAIARGDTGIRVNVVDLDEQEERKVLLSFDPIGDMAEVDEDAINALAEEISDWAEDGFSGNFLAGSDEEDDNGSGQKSKKSNELTTDGPDDRDADLLQKKWKTASGQVWRIPSESVSDQSRDRLIGSHIIAIGDSTDPETLKLALRGESPTLLVTSPPYWANQDYDTPAVTSDIQLFMRRCARAWAGPCNRTRRIILNTASTTSTAAAGHGDQGGKSDVKVKAPPFEKIWLGAMWSDALREIGWLARYRRFWLKNGIMLHPGPVSDLINEGVEEIICFYVPGRNEGGQERVGSDDPANETDWAQAGWWELPGVRGDGHPCPFHPEIPHRNILLYSKPGDTVFDPFLGQGTTIEAAEVAGRLGRGIEKDCGYAAVALERLSLMGLKPVLVG